MKPRLLILILLLSLTSLWSCSSKKSSSSATAIYYSQQTALQQIFVNQKGRTVPKSPFDPPPPITLGDSIPALGRSCVADNQCGDSDFACTREGYCAETCFFDVQCGTGQLCSDENFCVQELTD